MLGYEYRLTKFTAPASVASKGTLTCEVEGVNQGVAPFYYAWPVEAALLDDNGRVVARKNVATDVRRWLPGAFKISIALGADVPAGTYRVALGVKDPATQKASIHFANRLEVVDGYTVLGKILVKPLTN